MAKSKQKVTRDILCVTASMPSALVEALFEIIDGSDLTPTAWHDAETDRSRIDLFPNSPAQTEKAMQAFKDAAQVLAIDVEPELVTIARDDWAESWKRFFHVVKVSDRIIVRPSWEEYTAKEHEYVVTLDPGLSFGTGQHPTTQACLIFLDKLATEDLQRSVLDMGCGSAILAITARLLGFRTVSAFDNDSSSMQVALENGLINNVDFTLYCGDLAHKQPTAHIVLANILAPVLIRYAPQIVASMAPGKQSRLVLSGILTEQYSEVRAAYEALGLTEVETVLIENWRSALFQR